MLRGAQGGYTIFELMIVLFVSMVILASATITLQGTTGRTVFPQSMRDINSKLISWMGQVNNGFPGNANSNNSCQLDSNLRPQISSGASPTQQPDCIYIGKVIQFTSSAGCSGCQTGNIYAYSVFGRRTASGGGLADNLYNANPEPAAGPTLTTPEAKDLTEVYTMQGGTTIKSVTANLANDADSNHFIDVRLLGFTQSFNAHPSAANGAQNIYVYANLPSDNPPGNISAGGNVRACIELTSESCEPPNMQSDTLNAWPPGVKSLKVCFVSAYDSAKTALITISSTTGGASPQINLEFVAC